MFNQGGLVIEVDRQDLLEILHRNQAKHRSDYEEAKEAYRLKLIERCKEIITHAEVNTLKRGDVSLGLSCPESHEHSYQEAYEMVSLHKLGTLSLDQQSYRKFVKDEWEWKSSFSGTYLANTGKRL